MNGNGIISILLMGLAHFAAGEVAFKPMQSYPVGTNPNAAAVGDFNGDGKPDLAVLNSGDASVGDEGGVSILLGNGDGTFQPAKNLSICKNCTSIVTGDFDGDGKDDLVLVRPGDPTANDSGDVTIFLNNGDSTFRQGQVLTFDKNPASSNHAILALDLNGDRQLDLVVAHFDQFSVLLGNGNGTFQSPIAYSAFAAPAPIGLATVDLAGNGEKDLAVFGALSIDLWLSNGDGTFRHGPYLPNSELRAVGDFNGDKKDDLLVGTLSGVKICIYNCPPSGGGKISFHLLLGSGDGIFQLGSEVGNAIGAGDFDGDRKLDLFVPGNRQIQILPGNGDGTFQSPIAFATEATPPLFQVLDVNDDGAPDLVMSDKNSITLLINVGTDFSISASGLNPSILSAGQSATSSLTLKLLSNFDKPVSLTCAVQAAQPGGPACSLSSGSITFDANGEASATATISADSRAASLNSLQPFGKSSLLWLPVVGFAFLGTGIDVGPSRRRRLVILLTGAALSLGIIMQTACGGGGSSSASKSTAYTVMITGSSGATQHSTTVNLTVQ